MRKLLLWSTLLAVVPGVVPGAGAAQGESHAVDTEAVDRLKSATGGRAEIRFRRGTGAAQFVRLAGRKGEASLVASARRGFASEHTKAFFREYGTIFGIADADSQLEARGERTDKLGFKHATFQQVHNGVPVFGAELVGHVDGEGRLVAVNGTAVPAITVDTNARQSVDEAGQVALAVVAAGIDSAHGRDASPSPDVAVRNTRLVVYRTGLLRGVEGTDHLTYEVEIGNGADVREFVFVDAHTGKKVDQITGIHDALDRRAYDGAGLPNVPPSYPAAPYWVEGQPFPTASVEANNMILASGETHAMFMNAFGYDSFDGNGATMDAIFNRGYGCPNASWNGTFISFCPGFTTDDVTAHEWGHAYTQYTNNLIYAWQSGALNEAYSDIWGETVDLINGRGADLPNTVRASDNSCSQYGGAGTQDSRRWLMGEEVTGGALRDMWNPRCFADPGKVSDFEYACSTADQGGVHTNSGVINHAFALLVDGGFYNNHNILAIGLTKANHIYQRAAFYQVASSDFPEHADALEQACADLRGLPLASLTGAPGFQFITATDCEQVSKAIAAVELRTPPTRCNFVPQLAKNPPANVCTVGPANLLFSDSVEGSTAAWTRTHQGVFAAFNPRDWVQTLDLPGGRSGSAFFATNDPNLGNCSTDDESGVLFLDSPSITVPSTPGFPRVAFDHYMATEAGWDGGNIKVSVNGAAFQNTVVTQFVYNPYKFLLFSAGQGNTNPLAGQQAFTGADGGSNQGSWGTSILDLSSFARPGDNIRLRFAFGQDGCTGNDGWYVDNVNVYQCTAGGAATLSIGDVTVTEGNTGSANAAFTITLSEPSAISVTVRVSTADGNATAPSDYTALSNVLVTFAPGVTTRTVNVAVKGDIAFEPSETFLVNLGSPTNATIADEQAIGTITDDDDDEIADTARVFRLIHPTIGAYLFTYVPAERDSAQSEFGYVLEGECCKWFFSPAADGRMPMHRLFSSAAGDYLFTIYEEERLGAIALGYVYEGVAAYCNPTATPDAPVEWHRLRFQDKHLYTIYDEEVAAAIALGYEYEGVTCYLPNP